MISASESQTKIVLVRYGAIPEVARFRWSLGEEPQRGQSVVALTHHGLLTGTVLESVNPNHDPHGEKEIDFEVVRISTDEDRQTGTELSKRASGEFDTWLSHLERWRVDVHLLELEWTLDESKLIIYVLCDRGPESTKLAIQAAAEGLGPVEVQPVDREGLVSMPSGGGGCGSGGCGSGGCSH